MMKRIVQCIICSWLLTVYGAHAQSNAPSLTLKQAVDAALANNLKIQQSDLQMRAADINLRQAKANVFPDLLGSAGHGINQGRSIDPFTNSYINQNITYANYSLSSSVVLFNGFQLQNLIKQNSLDFLANKMDLQQTKDNVMLNVILAYLQILNNQELWQQAVSQAEVTRKQVDRLNTMNDEGAIAPALLYDLKGQLANDELGIVNSQNALNNAKLALSQLMNLPYQQNLQVENVTGDTLSLQYESDPATLYNISVKQLALIKAADYRRQSAARGVRVARGYYYPSLALGGSYNTNYSNAATRQLPLATAEIANGDYVNVNGGKVPVMTTVTNYQTEKISFGDQFKNNYNTSVFLSLQVPLFNKFRARNQVALAKLELQNAEVVAQSIKTELGQNIEQAYFNTTAAIDKYHTLQQQVADFSESFRTAEVRFEAGAITQVDYLIAKNNVDRAKANFISAKYDLVFRTKILDYYRGTLAL